MNRGGPRAFPRGAARRILSRRTVLAAAGAALALAGCGTMTGASTSRGGRAVIGYVPYWDQEHAFDVVHQHPGTFTHISPMWYSLDREGRIVLADDDNTWIDAGEVRFLQDSGIQVIPTLTNLRNGDWEPGLVSAMLKDPALRRGHVDFVVEHVERNGYDGIDIDYEELRADDREPYSDFLRSLGEGLRRNGRLLTSSVYAKESEPGPNDHNIAQDYAAIASACDQVRVMTYDYHYATSEPGPVAPSGWVDNVVAWATAQVPARKLILGIVLLGYDWPAGGEGQTVSYEQAMATAHDRRVTVEHEEPGRSPTFSYTDMGNREHEVWFEDALSTEVKLRFVADYDLGGVAFWRLGGEDPRTWDLLDPRTG